MTTDRIYEVQVAASAEEAWNALTDPQTVRRYYFDTAPRTTWEVGSPIEFVDDDGDAQITGTVLEFEPPTRLAMSRIVPADSRSSLMWAIAASNSSWSARFCSIWVTA